jgi:hypothetical protein
MTTAEWVYVVAGTLLPAYYLPQMLKCAIDETQLAAYSMSKAACQLVLRMAMLPFVFGIGNLTMTCVVSLDFAGRACEFSIAVWSLLRQGVPVRTILSRCLPFGRLRARSGQDLAAWPVAAPPAGMGHESNPVLPSPGSGAGPSSSGWQR